MDKKKDKSSKFSTIMKLNNFSTILIGFGVSSFTALLTVVVLSFFMEPNSKIVSSRILNEAKETESVNSAQRSRSFFKSSPYIPSEGLVILYIFSGIFLGSVLKEIKKKTTIPYSPLILISGLVIGIFHQYLSIFGEAVELVNQIDPHTLLMIFIPGLIFESAYNTDGFILSRSKW